MNVSPPDRPAEPPPGDGGWRPDAALRRRRQEVLERWEARARDALPAARSQSRPALLDSLPEFVDRLIEALARDDAPGEAMPQHARDAIEHGRQRAQLSG